MIEAIASYTIGAEKSRCGWAAGGFAATDIAWCSADPGTD